MQVGDDERGQGAQDRRERTSVLGEDRVTPVEQATTTQEDAMSTTETGHVTGTKDKDYNIIWFTENCLDNVLRLETYIQDAERDGDNELAEFFRRAQGESRKGADQGKQLLRKRITG
jgi:hypothetical protein